MFVIHSFRALDRADVSVAALKAEDFSAVRVAAGDSFGVATSDLGELRAWGSFRVRPSPFVFTADDS